MLKVRGLVGFGEVTSVDSEKLKTASENQIVAKAKVMTYNENGGQNEYWWMQLSKKAYEKLKDCKKGDTPYISGSVVKFTHDEKEDTTLLVFDAKPAKDKHDKKDLKLLIGGNKVKIGPQIEKEKSVIATLVSVEPPKKDGDDWQQTYWNNAMIVGKAKSVLSDCKDWERIEVKTGELHKNIKGDKVYHNITVFTAALIEKDLGENDETLENKPDMEVIEETKEIDPVTKAR